MFTIRLEFHDADAPFMNTRVYSAEEYGTIERPDGSKEITIPNEHGVEIYHCGFSRAFVMNDAGATIEKIDNRGRNSIPTAHEAQSAA